jgi:hypothetical protein
MADDLKRHFPSLVMEELIRANPDLDDIWETALQEALNVHAKRFKSRPGSSALTDEHGNTIDDFVKTLRTTNPWWFPSTEPDLQQRAFLEGNMTARSEIIKNEGMEKYKMLAEQWSADPINPKIIGKQPGAERALGPDAAEKRARDHKSNPWSKQGWSLTKQGECIKVMGLDGAARLAKAVGCVVGSTKPNPAYNK